MELRSAFFGREVLVQTVQKPVDFASLAPNLPKELRDECRRRCHRFRAYLARWDSSMSLGVSAALSPLGDKI
eukprot:1362719-Amorphochlora_amoeboformis.AAC.1